jgi:transcriptional regulator with XRE-family HTH domain
MTVMAKKTALLLPATDELLRQFGDRLRLARLRRRLSAKQVAERAGMAPMTLRSLERGGSGVTMGAYLAVMQVLGIEKDLDLLGKADPVGRELQDARLPARSKTPRAAMPSVQPRESMNRPHAPSRKTKKPLKPSEDAQDWIKKSGFASADALAGLIEHSARPSKKGH